MADEKKKTSVKPITEVILRSYPKVIFFYPLFFTSLILWPIQFVLGTPAQWLGAFWMIVLFCNLFVIAFDFSSSKFFILILAIVILVLVGIFFILPIYTGPTISEIEFNLGITAEFYMTTTIILGIVLLFVIFDAYFDYWKVERNEIYHKKGLFSAAERYPVKSLRLKKTIPDVFEFFILRAGTMVLMPGRSDEAIALNTVLNVNKKADQIDYLLSHISVEPDEIDG
ncbi:MAG: hypothetical protein EU532_09990 [Promethearchaeota archaeon]|nr:MAG: hypothetical protein EU532_09990 [Candidatus Lokiarchaeota archaeon]